MSDEINRLKNGEAMSSHLDNGFEFGTMHGWFMASVVRSIKSDAVNGKIKMSAEFQITEGDLNIEPGSISEEDLDAFQSACTLRIYDPIWDDIFGSISEYYGFKWENRVDMPEGTMNGPSGEA
jgi:hypothetical protein